MYQVNDDNSIYVTRGDIVIVSVSAENNGKPYTFRAGEVLRIKVYGKKDAESVVLQKDFPVTADTQSVDLFLSEEDTKIGEVISKPKDYWYEVELNPFDNPQTIIGYNEDGACVFRLFPEGDDIPEYVPDPETIKVIDTELDMTSERPVQNQVIARAFANLQAGYQATHEAVAKLHVTPQMFGAIGDGEADDTEALQMAIDNASSMVSLGGKTYYISDTLILKSNLTISGQGAKIFRKSSAGTVENTLRGFDVKNITIEGVEFASEHNQECVNVPINGNGKVSNIDAIHCKNVENLRVLNCRFTGLTGGVKIDEDLADTTSVINHGLMIDGCVFDETVYMPIYTGGLAECCIRNCDISAYGESTKHCHHIYISSACKNFYIYGNSFKGGTGQDINAGSSYEGATQPTDIHIFNNEFTDFKLLLSVLGGRVHFDSNACRSTVAEDCIYVISGGKLRMSNCDISVNTPLFDTLGFDIVMTGCTVSCHGVLFTAADGSYFSAKSCGFTLLNGTSAVDITSAATVKVLLKGCVFNTTLTDNQVAFLSRHAGCVVVVDGCSVNNTVLKNFASDSRAGRAYVVGCTFTGFSKVFFSETDAVKSLNNQLIADIV